MRAARTSDLWWKSAIVYQLQVRTFAGDLAGLVERMDHVAQLGASCIWLMPFYPSPRRDDGYDVTNHQAVDPRYGDLGIFTEVLRHAHDRGLRVIIDLVPNHTSDEHHWFTEHPERYVWADEPDDRGEQHWTERDGRYYLHQFQSFQPDVDIRRQEVRDHIARTMGFWLTLGVDGFRIDAVPYLVEREGPRGVTTEQGKAWLHDLREHAMRARGTAVLMGEVNVDASEIESYFGEHGDALHLQLAFLINQRLWLSLAREEAAPLEDLVRHLPVPPPDGGWAVFLRNHDELSLDQLSEDEQRDVHAAFAPDEDMLIYGHGIRRRLAGLLGGDGPRLRMALSLLLTLPGTPVLFSGDEVALVEDLSLEGRMASRVPMDWDAVAEQRRRPGSLLRHVQHLLRARRLAPEFGWGASTLLENAPPEVFAHRCEWEADAVVAVHNLAGHPVEVDLDVGAVAVHDLLELCHHDVRDGRLHLHLEAYGHHWLRLERE